MESDPPLPAGGLLVSLLAFKTFLRCGDLLDRSEAVGPSDPPVPLVRAFALPSRAPGSPANARSRRSSHHRNCVRVWERVYCAAQPINEAAAKKWWSNPEEGVQPMMIKK